jgi:hypothetical protein
MLADIFDNFTRNSILLNHVLLKKEDLNKAMGVEPYLKNTFPWMAEVALDSRDAVADAIKDRFTQLVKADKRDAGQVIADHMIVLAIKKSFYPVHFLII